MNISEIRVKLVPESSERLRAFCSVTLDNSFVIRDLKIIDGGTGPFVAMPSRKMMDHCPKCSGKNNLRAKFCNDCGARLDENRAPRDPDGRIKLYADIAHPITTDCRLQFQTRVIEAFERELELSRQPGYEAKHDLTGMESDDSEGGYEELVAELKESRSKQKEPAGLTNATGQLSPPTVRPVTAPRSMSQSIEQSPTLPTMSRIQSNHATPREKDSGFATGIL